MAAPVVTRSHSVLARLVGVIAAVATLGTALLVVGATAASANTDESSFLAKVNASRQQHGLRALVMAPDLVSVARSWSQHMASSQTLSHNPNLTTQVTNWQAVGENVGVGPDVDSIETAFMNSTHHRENILDPGYTEIGIGTVRDSKGQLWVTQDFRQPMNSSASGSASTSTSVSTQPSRSSTGASAPVARRVPVSAAPAAAPTPREVLAQRLADARKSVHASPDPLRQAAIFAATMSMLAGR